MSMICDKRQSFPVLCVRDGQEPLHFSMWHLSILDVDSRKRREEDWEGRIRWQAVFPVRVTRTRLCPLMNISSYFSLLSF